MKVKPLVSVIIPVYNRAFMLDRVIRSLESQTYREMEVLMVDDASSDDSPAIMANSPRIKHFAHDKNRGPAAARNTALKFARGELVLFMDSDALAPDNLVEIHVNCHLKHPGSIVQGQVISIMNLEDAFRVPFGFRHYSRAFFATGNVSVEKVYLDAVGRFDEDNFRKGWEDLELGLRLRDAGLKVRRLYNQGFVWHYEGDIRGADSIREYFADRYLEGWTAVDFYRKHPRLTVKWMTMAGKFFFFLGKVIFNERYLESAKFHDKVLALWREGKKGAAFNKLDFAAYHYYLKGVAGRIQKDGYLLRK